MKSLFTILCSLLISFSAFAQNFENEVAVYQSIYGMEKSIIVEEIINLEETDSEVFWNLYNEYEGKRKELGQLRIELIANYAENYNDLTDEKMDELVNKTAKLNSELNKIILAYYQKIKKQNNTKVAAQFYQLENFFLTEIRAAILEQIPFIDELKSEE